MGDSNHLFSAVIIVVTLLFSTPGLSQNHKMDSLKTVLKSANDSDKIEILIRLGAHYRKYDKELSLVYLEDANNLALTLKDTAQMVRASRVWGELLRLYERDREAMEILSRALPFARKQNSNELKYILNSLGLIYAVEADYTKALEFQLESLDIRKSNSDSSELSIGLNSLGFVYYKLKNYRKALTYFINSLEIKNKINEHYGLDQLMINISLCYANLNELEQAKRYAEKGIAICGKDCSEDFLMQVNYCKGLIAYGENRFGEAEKHFTLSLVKAKKNNNLRLQFDNIENLSQIYLNQNRIQEALIHLKEAEELIKEKPPYNLELIKIYKCLYQLFSKSGNLERLSYYQKKYIQLKDSIYNEEFTNNLVRIEAKFIDKENERTFLAQSHAILLKDEAIKRQRLLNLFMGCMTAMLVLLAFLLVRNNRQRRKINQILDEKVKQRTEQLQESYDAMLRSNEERNLVAERTSMDIKSSVLTLKGLCSVAIHDIKDEQANEYISKISFTTDQIMEELKRFQNLTQLSALDRKHFSKQ